MTCLRCFFLIFFIGSRIDIFGVWFAVLFFLLVFMSFVCARIFPFPSLYIFIFVVTGQYLYAAVNHLRPFPHVSRVVRISPALDTQCLIEALYTQPPSTILPLALATLGNLNKLPLETAVRLKCRTLTVPYALTALSLSVSFELLSLSCFFLSYCTNVRPYSSFSSLMLCQ